MDLSEVFATDKCQISSF